MEEEKKQTIEKSVIEKIKEATEKKLEELEKQGLSQNNVDYLGKVIDIHKDIMNEEYWQLVAECKHCEYISVNSKNFEKFEYDN